MIVTILICRKIPQKRKFNIATIQHWFCDAISTPRIKVLSVPLLHVEWAPRICCLYNCVYHYFGRGHAVARGQASQKMNIRGNIMRTARKEKTREKRSLNRKMRKLISATKEWTRQDDEYRETSTTLPFSSLIRLSALCIFSMEPGARLERWGRRFQGESEKVRKERRLLPWTRAIWMNRNATCSEMRWKELSQGKDRSEKVWTTACGGGWLHEKRYNEKPNRTDDAGAKINLQTKMYFQDSSAEK